MATRALPLLDGYEIVERIGRGAGAVISLARELESRRMVAIKHVVRRDAEDDKFITQAENEFQVARDLDHPFLRRCYDIVRVRKWLSTRELFLVMEYVAGERLEDVRPESMRDVLRIFRQAAQGLQALHQRGYAHADIKPNNIILTPAGGMKIIDFGQSCPLGHIKQRVQGTPDYIAPEQVHRREIDQQTDVFNLGATLYWVVTGKWFKTLVSAAPTGARRIEVESARGNEPPDQLNPKVPRPLSSLIVECCAHAKAERPRDMGAVLARLDIVEHVLDTPKRHPPRSSSGRGKKSVDARSARKDDHRR